MNIKRVTALLPVIVGGSLCIVGIITFNAIGENISTSELKLFASLNAIISGFYFFQLSKVQELETRLDSLEAMLQAKLR